MVSERTKYKIKDIFELSAGGDVDRAHFSVYKTDECCYPIYSNSLENFGLYGYTSNPKYKADSVTITGRGSVGHAEYRANKFDAIIRLLVLEPKGNNVCAQFVADYINNCVDFPLESTGVPQLTAPQIMNIELELPQYDKQKNIAALLSDVNNLIDTLDKQIQKKKAIKQGAMQELLTGKRRLPGFDGKWQSFVFGDLFDFIPNNAFTRAQMDVSGRVKNIHYGDILTKYGAYISADSKDIPYIAKEIDLSRFSAKCYLQSGDLVIADTAEDETVGKALEVINVECPVLAGQHTLLCRPKVRFAEKFLGYYLNASCYHDQLLPYIVGTKVSSVSKASIAQTKLVVPKYEEQQEISSILSDMDNDITELEQKLAKYRQVKQGMMQQLLTGKIRLVQRREKDEHQATALENS